MNLFLTTTKNSFEGQRGDEVVIILLRRHWFVLALMIFGFSLLALIPFALLFYFYNELRASGLISLGWFVTLLFFAIVWQVLFYRIMDYLLDTWIVTDHRVIDSQQLGFFHRRVAEARVDRVQDIATDINSLIPTLLNFGNVEVQTAGTVEKIFFSQVPDPNEVKRAIVKAGNEFRAKHPRGAEGEL